MIEVEHDPRGRTYTETWRHECEVRYILSLPSREARREWLDHPLLLRTRGQAAVDRLKADVAAAWNAARATPIPRGQEPAPDCLSAADAAVNGSVNDRLSKPDDGSFLPAATAGNSTPVVGVHSEVSAR